MPPVVLGLDIGGANLKAATADRRAVSVPFALWKQPDRLPAVLAELVASFPDAEEFAVTMTGELCDCFETKREGVNAILTAVDAAAGGQRVRVWCTDGRFVTTRAGRAAHMKVAAANWHALATFAGRYAPKYGGLLLDVGSTTTDVIPLIHGIPIPIGLTDMARLQTHELVYVGVRRTPVCAIATARTASEFFATTQDVFIVLGLIPEEPDNRETADGRSATIEYSLARLARMLGADLETISRDHIAGFARSVDQLLLARLKDAIRFAYQNCQSEPPELRTIILSGSGEFLARRAAERAIEGAELVSLTDRLGPSVSACAPAYALAVLATEQRP